MPELTGRMRLIEPALTTYSTCLVRSTSTRFAGPPRSAGARGAFRAASVCLPTEPSTDNPCTFWKAITALRSVGPGVLSAAPTK